MSRFIRLFLFVSLLLLVFVIGRAVPGGQPVAVAAPPPPADVLEGGDAAVEDNGPAAPLGGGEQVKFIGLMDFRPSNSAIQYRYGGGLDLTATAASNSFYAPIALPQGATITGVTYYLVDSAATNIDVSVRRLGPTEAPTMFGHALTSGVNDNVQSTYVAATVTVDNANYAYYLRIELDAINGTHSIHGAKVHYLLPAAAFLPTTTK